MLGVTPDIIIVNLDASQVPKTNHMVEIALEPYVIHHLKARQCGAEFIKGDIINPKIVDGVQ